MADTQPDLNARSPWSSLEGVERIHIHPMDAPVSGTLRVPGSKSLTNRALIIAALADGESRLDGILQSDDSYWCIDVLRRLGVPVFVSGDSVHVKGCGGRWPNPDAALYLGASGTLARFLPGALALANHGRWTLDGGGRLRERPLGPLLSCLSALGAQFTYAAEPDALPFALEASGLQGGEVSISGDTSSQFISGLLMAAPYAKTPLTIHVTSPIVQQAYVRMTIELMQTFGVSVTQTDDLRTLTVHPSRYQAQHVRLEADASTSCYFFALAAVTGGRVCVENLPEATHQPDIGVLELLARMGCTVTRQGEAVTVQGPQLIEGRPALRGGFTASMQALSDQTLTLAAVAVFADAPVTLNQVAHIRAHESDRIRAICESLHRLGIQTHEYPDGLTIYPGHPKPAVLPSYDDHRVAMSLAILAAASNGADIIDPGCVSKTCPEFFQLLGNLGVHMDGAHSL